jgi:hypothetical protein
MDAPLVIGVVSFTRPHPKVPARGTRLKTRVITTAYVLSSIPFFQENFRDALKAYAGLRQQIEA